MKRIIVSLVAVLMVVFGFGTAFAENMPSSKSAVAMSGIALIDSTVKTADWEPVLKAALKVPEQKDLSIDVSLECGLFTDTLVRSKGGTKDTSVAESSVKVRVGVYDQSGSLVMHAVPAGVEGVVYARRSQELSATFQGILEGCMSVDENGMVVIDEECLEPEEVELVLDTMNANAFNFLAPNLSSGVYTLVVEAKIDSSTAAGAGSAQAMATVGRGSMIVEEIRMIKGADGSTL